MAGGADTGEDDGLISGINVTPLVDVVLVLLIILMVTAKQLVQQESIQMDLPTASGAGETPVVPTTMTISVEADGTMHLNMTQNDEQTLAQTQINREQLRTYARQAHEADPEARAVLSIDAAVSHGDTIAIIDILRTEQVTKFAFSTRRPSDLPSSPAPSGSAEPASGADEAE